MGQQCAPERLLYDFCLEDPVPVDHLLRGIDRVLDLSDIRLKLRPFYSHTGRSSVDPELMIRMLLIGCCFGIRSERWLCQGEARPATGSRGEAERTSILPIAGFAGWGLKVRLPITRLSRSTGMVAFASARPSGWYSRASCAAA